MGLGIGHELAKLEDLTGDAYLIRLNGAELHRSSSHTDQSPSEVLQRYESYCRESPSLLGRAMRDIPATLSDRAVLPSESPLRVAVVRDEKEDRGMVACFVEDPDVSAEALGASLVAFAETGDLSKLGRFRYAFAERSTSARGGTHVVTFWSDGELNVGKMFPAAGDAPGTDSSIAPRPEGSRRTFSASVEGYPGAVRVYECSARRAVIEKMYDETLVAKGFTRVAAKSAKRGVAYVDAGNAEVVVAFVEERERTIVTIVEASAPSTTGVHVEVQR